jgi:hypothetical protein
MMEANAQRGHRPRDGNDWFKKCVAVCLLIITASLAYYFVIYLPRERAARLEMEQQEKVARERREREQLEVQRQAEQTEREKLELQQQKLELERQEILGAEKRRVGKIVGLNACLNNAYSAYQKSWRETCWRLGNPDDKCLLPKPIANDLEKDLRDSESNCHRLYPQR